MSGFVTNEEMMFNWMLQKRQWVKDVLFKPLKDSYKPHKVNSNIAGWILATQICIDLNLNIDDTEEFLETINIEELLK